MDKCMICGAPTAEGDFACRGDCATKYRNTMRYLQQLQHYAGMLEALAEQALSMGDVVLHGAHAEAARVYSTLIGRLLVPTMAGAIRDRLEKKGPEND